MKSVKLFDHLKRPVFLCECLVYTEDSSIEPIFDYADSLIRVDSIVQGRIHQTTLIYNELTRGTSFKECLLEDSLSLEIFDLFENDNENESVLKVRLLNHYKMTNPEDVSIPNLERELRIIRNTNF